MKINIIAINIQFNEGLLSVSLGFGFAGTAGGTATEPVGARIGAFAVALVSTFADVFGLPEVLPIGT